MTVKVDLDQLSAALADRAFAYLVTVGDDYRAHTVAVHPELVEGMLGIGSVGNSTRRNASSHADVTLVWPPRESGGYTLIVDGLATMAGGALTVEPTGAVLHRPATPASPSGTVLHRPVTPAYPSESGLNRPATPASPSGTGLNRPATPASPSGTGCGDDCIPLG